MAEVAASARQETRDDRRVSLRRVRALEFEEHDLDGGGYARVTEDISLGGLSARVGFARRPGDRLWLRVYLPLDDMAPLDLHAEVVGTFSAREGLRLRFLDLESGNLAALEDFMRSERMAA